MILDGMDGDPSASMEDSGPLHEAASTGKMVTCKYLVEQVGFDINAEANNDSGMCVECTLARLNALIFP